MTSLSNLMKSPECHPSTSPPMTRKPLRQGFSCRLRRQTQSPYRWRVKFVILTKMTNLTRQPSGGPACRVWFRRCVRWRENGLAGRLHILSEKGNRRLVAAPYEARGFFVVLTGSTVVNESIWQKWQKSSFWQIGSSTTSLTTVTTSRKPLSQRILDVSSRQTCCRQVRRRFLLKSSKMTILASLMTKVKNPPPGGGFWPLRCPCLGQIAHERAILSSTRVLRNPNRQIWGWGLQICRFGTKNRHRRNGDFCAQESPP